MPVGHIKPRSPKGQRKIFNSDNSLNCLCSAGCPTIMQVMAKSVSSLRPSRRQWLLLALLAIALYVLVPQIGDFRHSLTIISHLRWSLAGLAVISAALTYVAAAGNYYLLAFKPLAYGRTLLVQLAAMFVNRLLPAGIGALGVSYLYLRRARHTTSQATTVVAVNNTLGVIGHLILVVGTITIFHSTLLAGHVRAGQGVPEKLWLIPLIITLLAVLIATRLSRRLRAGFRAVLVQLRFYRRRPDRLMAALLTSMSLTLTNIGCLWLCVLAVHAQLPLPVILIVFTLGIGVGNVTPTPGGLGGLEAGLVAGLIAYRLPSATALAAVLLYRLISYWLALAIGALAFIVCRRRGYLALT